MDLNKLITLQALLILTRWQSIKKVTMFLRPTGL